METDGDRHTNTRWKRVEKPQTAQRMLANMRKVMQIDFNLPQSFWAFFVSVWIWHVSYWWRKLAG